MAKLNLPVEFLNDYIDHIKTDYIKWWGAKVDEPVVQEMIEKFVPTFEVGSAYVKVISNNSVHSFIVNKAGKKFPLGAILKPASWSAPATNFARADLLSRETWTGRVQWTGAL